MRIADTEARDNRWEYLQEATGENTKSGAIDAAAKYVIAMEGAGVTDGKLQELMATATREGSLTPSEIADILDTSTIPVSAETSWSVGQDE